MIETGLIALVTPDAYVEADDLAIEDGGRRGLRLREASSEWVEASERVPVARDDAAGAAVEIREGAAAVRNRRLAVCEGDGGARIVQQQPSPNRPYCNFGARALVPAITKVRCDSVT